MTSDDSSEPLELDIDGLNFAGGDFENLSIKVEAIGATGSSGQ